MILIHPPSFWTYRKRKFMKFKNYVVTMLSLLSMLVVLSAHAFRPDECLNAQFQTEVKHKIGPFGLLEITLKVSKSNCKIQIEHKKFYAQNYEIDVCRTPIHIKKGTGGVDVIKRVDCTDKKNTSDFCDQLQMLENILQDDGLIFADGEKEILTSANGQIYCAFSLIQKYLRDGDVLSRFEEKDRVQGTFEELPPSVTTQVPTQVPNQAVTPIPTH